MLNPEITGMLVQYSTQYKLVGTRVLHFVSLVYMKHILGPGVQRLITSQQTIKQSKESHDSIPSVPCTSEHTHLIDLLTKACLALIVTQILFSLLF